MMSSDKSGMFGSYNVPVTMQPGGITSPYLNFNPDYVTQNESQYILPEGAEAHRGRFELAFSTIGTSVGAGAVIGGGSGLYRGMREAANLSGKAKRTQLLNFVAKQGASTAQTFGVVALLYSGIGVIISKVRGAEDELNTLTAATLTGLTYKSSAGMKQCLRGGGVGFGLATVYCLFTSKDRIQQMFGSRSR